MRSTVAALLGALLWLLAMGAVGELSGAFAQSALSRSQGPPIERGSGFRLPGGSERVRELQVGLRELGYPLVDGDGQFGPRTERAVKEFQRRHGLPRSGVVRRRTVRELREALASARARAVPPPPSGGPSSFPGVRAPAARPAVAVRGVRAARAEPEPNGLGPVALLLGFAAALAAMLGLRRRRTGRRARRSRMGRRSPHAPEGAASDGLSALAQVPGGVQILERALARSASSSARRSASVRPGGGAGEGPGGGAGPAGGGGGGGPGA